MAQQAASAGMRMTRREKHRRWLRWRDEILFPLVALGVGAGLMGYAAASFLNHLGTQ